MKDYAYFYLKSEEQLEGIFIDAVKKCMGRIHSFQIYKELIKRSQCLNLLRYTKNPMRVDLSSLISNQIDVGEPN